MLDKCAGLFYDGHMNGRISMVLLCVFLMVIVYMVCNTKYIKQRVLLKD